MSIRRLRLTLAFIGVLVLAAGIPAARAQTESDTLVDTLGSATSTTQFSVFGSAGFAVSASELWGPSFTLSQPTVITEIGGFFNNCTFIIPFVPNCPATSPFIVRVVRASPGGAPDPSSLLATFVLSHDGDPFTVSYESVAPDVLLGEGTYFALFGAQNQDLGQGLMTATIPFTYRSGITRMGFVNLIQGTARVSPGEFAALRILGRVASVADLLAGLLGDVADVGPGTSLASKVRAAQGAYTAGRESAACEILGAFINEVEAQAGKHIPIDSANALIAAAGAIKDAMAC
jgi:hypothetical protein